MINREEVAKQAGVSAMTVSRVVMGKGYVSEKTRRKVQQAIDSLGYIPNKIASGLVSGKSNRIGLVVPDFTNPYYLQVVDAMIEEGRSHGYVISVYKANSDELPQVLESIISNRMAGVVNLSSCFSEKYANQFNEIGAKTIYLKHNDFVIDIDYDASIKQAIESLVDRGAKRIIFISGMEEKYYKYDLRVRWFIKHLTDSKLYFDSDSIVFGNYPREEAFTEGYNLAIKLAQKGVEYDAAFCINDMMAFGVINGLKKVGKKVPDDVAIIGFDNIPMAEFYQPSLSSIESDIRKEARLYFQYILGNDISSENKIVSRFIERESSAIGGIKQ